LFSSQAADQFGQSGIHHVKASAVVWFEERMVLGILIPIPLF